MRLAGEVALITGESKTRAIRVALEERLARLRAAETPEQRHAQLTRFLEDEVCRSSRGSGYLRRRSRTRRSATWRCAESAYQTASWLSITPIAEASSIPASAPVKVPNGCR